MLSPAEITALTRTGLILCGLLVLLVLIAMSISRDRKWVGVLFLLLIGSATWGALAKGSACSNTLRLALWATNLSIVLSVFSATQWISNVRYRRALMMENPRALAEPSTEWPLVSPVTVVVGLFQIPMIVFCLLGPVESAEHRSLMGLLLVPASGLAAGTLLVNAWRRWNPLSAQAGMWLMNLCLCTVVTTFLRPESTEWEKSFSFTLAGIVISLSIMIIFWNWLAKVWEQQLDNGTPWTMAGRLQLMIPAFTLKLGLLSVTAVGVMSFYPLLLRGDNRSTFSDSLPVCLVAHFLLILSLIAARSRWRAVSFYGLTLAAVAGLAACVILRVAL